jgi:lipopolysaccharide biosynthesis glycosyltransferase
MEVLCASDERYLPHAATMLCSLLEHNRVFRIHYFYSSIPDKELAKLRSFVSKCGSELVCYEVVPETFAQLRVDKWASPAVYYRLLVARLLPSDINKILYLDADLIVRSSLGDLWNTDITDQPLAAIADYWQDPKSLEVLPPGEKLFNSGVMLINLKAWRQNSIPEQAIDFAKNNSDKVQLWDQDALNAVLARQWTELPLCWNAQHEEQWLRGPGHATTSYPAIVHFISGSKPWQWDNRHPFKAEYNSYRLKTPWWQYEQEGKPTLPRRLYLSLRAFVLDQLPVGFRQWLRSRISGSQA